MPTAAFRPRDLQMLTARLRAQSGSITLWLLGVCVMLLFLGGLSLDLWRAFSERRALAGIADAAAVAGASGIDVGHFRATGEVRLDPRVARRIAGQSIAGQTDVRSLTGVSAIADTDRVVVTVVGEVPLSLMRVLMPDTPALRIEVRSSAEPIRGP